MENSASTFDDVMEISSQEMINDEKDFPPFFSTVPRYLSKIYFWYFQTFIERY